MIARPFESPQGNAGGQIMAANVSSNAIVVAFLFFALK
jgi:hypothetical protein